ncbi:MAG TPA: hypothetical protein VHX18_02310 [Rhizomicrobium sp.]|jgi:hypothetical protein|nr:hypothetical protein [Rhizomicrobium sp.]
MTSTTSGILTLLLIIACVACALYRLAGSCLPPKTPRMRSLPKGPSYLLAFIGFWAALFLAIPLTVVWGLFLAAILVICHIVALWKLHLSNPA